MINDNLYIRQRLARYLQIRRCSSCRLRRCFEVGMKEELVRTDEENQRYRELVEINRKRREVSKQQLEAIYQLSIPQVFVECSTISKEYIVMMSEINILFFSDNMRTNCE